VRLAGTIHDFLVLYGASDGTEPTKQRSSAMILFKNHPLYATLAVLIAIATFQYSTPVFNAAVDLPCCESEEIQCCQGDFPSRMVCCISSNERGLDSSTPTQTTLISAEKKRPIAVALHSIRISQATLSISDSPRSPTVSIPSVSTSRLYQDLCTFLI